jgi:hypothetical protein
MRVLPNFLIIGAMKAGTTTLYDDLSKISGIYMPPEKEPNDLIYPQIETQQGLEAYAKKFASAPVGAVVGEASTAYSKLPTYHGVADRAFRLLGPQLKIIYVTRDPVKRILSQYHHLWGLGLEARDIKDAVLSDETYVAYSDYERQLVPWREAFSDRNILIVSFEDYIKDRAPTLSLICNFLGVPFNGGVGNSHRNASEGKRVVPPSSTWSIFAHSNFYLYKVKPYIPGPVRDFFKKVLLAKSRKLSEDLDQETVAELRRRLKLDV